MTAGHAVISQDETHDRPTRMTTGTPALSERSTTLWDITAATNGGQIHLLIVIQ
jgi:hypothetical protein